jgi:hypothetical protein
MSKSKVILMFLQLSSNPDIHRSYLSHHRPELLQSMNKGARAGLQILQSRLSRVISTPPAAPLAINSNEVKRTFGIIINEGTDPLEPFLTGRYAPAIG